MDSFRDLISLTFILLGLLLLFVFVPTLLANDNVNKDLGILHQLNQQVLSQWMDPETAEFQRVSRCMTIDITGLLEKKKCELPNYTENGQKYIDKLNSCIPSQELSTIMATCYNQHVKAKP